MAAHIAAARQAPDPSTGHGVLTRWAHDATLHAAPTARPNSGGLRFAFYGRVSTEDPQDPATSRAWHLLGVQALASAHGRIVAEYFDVGRSRTLPWARRPQAAALLAANQMGKAAFDAVGPLLLIGWAEVGPGLLQAMNGMAEQDGAHSTATQGPPDREAVQYEPRPIRTPHDALLERARREDAEHWEPHRRPISAETLRKRLHIGAARSRTLVATLRDDRTEGLNVEPCPSVRTSRVPEWKQTWPR
ncbi:hypothetical protein [Streptomyces sp. NPDC001123]